MTALTENGERFVSAVRHAASLWSRVQGADGPQALAVFVDLFGQPVCVLSRPVAEQLKRHLRSLGVEYACETSDRGAHTDAVRVMPADAVIPPDARLSMLRERGPVRRDDEDSDGDGDGDGRGDSGRGRPVLV